MTDKAKTPTKTVTAIVLGVLLVVAMIFAAFKIGSSTNEEQMQEFMQKYTAYAAAVDSLTKHTDKMNDSVKVLLAQAESREQTIDSLNKAIQVRTQQRNKLQTQVVTLEKQLGETKDTVVKLTVSGEIIDNLKEQIVIADDVIAKKDSVIVVKDSVIGDLKVAVDIAVRRADVLDSTLKNLPKIKKRWHDKKIAKFGMFITGFLLGNQLSSDSRTKVNLLVN